MLLYVSGAAVARSPIAFIFVPPICPRHPGEGTLVPWEVHQAAELLLCAHGTPTPPRFSPSCPHCVIPAIAGAVTGQKYHYPVSHLMAAAGYSPGICSWFESLPADIRAYIRKSAPASFPILANPCEGSLGNVQFVPETYLMKCVFSFQSA